MPTESGWRQTKDGKAVHIYGRRIDSASLEQVEKIIAIFDRAEREHLTDEQIAALLKDLSDEEEK